MFTGATNPNDLVPLEKLKITNLENKETFYVLYNPQSYVQQRSVNYSQINMLGTDAPVVQFQNGNGETLSLELFFDSLSSSTEVGGTSDRQKAFESNSRRQITETMIDVRDYTQEVYKLMTTQSDVHRPPRLLVEWASLQFTGFLVSCEQTFTKFDDMGYPVRAILKCEFLEHRDADKLSACNPLESPDTTKFRTIRQGDSLWALAAREYGESGQWREIAAANGIVNPRRLRAGERLILPALD